MHVHLWFNITILKILKIFSSNIDILILRMARKANYGLTQNARAESYQTGAGNCADSIKY
jgi:hypothetical protein